MIITEKYSSAFIFANKPEVFRNSFVDYSLQSFCSTDEFFIPSINIAYVLIHYQNTPR